ncbi:MAG: ergothioneine biosynthesis protein EgtC [Gammaproteobacteria bacterium]
MCRLLSYLGPAIALSELILTPEHSLEKQAWQPRELREAKLNADGFGIGWYSHGSVARYRQSMPIWNDPNLHDLSQSIQQPLWLAMVRSATPGLGTHHSNTQPFSYQQWLFMHNGYILDFPRTARPQIRHILNHEFEANIRGDTDSEYIFALILHFLAKSKNPIDAIRISFDTIAELIGPERALLNILLTDGERIYASKHAINGLCPSLYYGRGIEPFASTSQLLVSEPLNEDQPWTVIDDHSLVVLGHNQELQSSPL